MGALVITSLAEGGSSEGFVGEGQIKNHLFAKKLIDGLRVVGVFKIDFPDKLLHLYFTPRHVSILP